MRAAAASFVFACAVVACAPARVAQEPAARFHAGEVQPSTRAVRGTDLVRAPGSSARYTVTEGARKGTTLEQRVSRDGDRVLVREEAIDREGARTPSEDMRLRVGENGALILEEVVTHTERSASLFRDGLPFAAETLRPGEVLEGRSPMSVLSVPARTPRGKGSAERSIRIAGESQVELAGERLVASVVDLVFTVELDVAKAHVTARLYVVEGRGVVAEDRTEEIRVLGIFPRRSVERVVLTELGPKP